MAPPTTTPSAPLPAENVDAQMPGDQESPSGQVRPSGSNTSIGMAEDPGLPVLASVLELLKVDRLSRQQELSKSDERFNRLEEWLGRLTTGDVSRPHVVGSGGRAVPSQHGIGASLLQRSSLPSRRETISPTPLTRANDESGGSLGSGGIAIDREINDEIDVMPSVSKRLSEWMKNAQKITGKTVSAPYTGQYWDVWKRKMTMALQEAKLIKYISSSFVPPVQDASSLEWHQYCEGDPMTQRFILKHLDEVKGQELAFMTSACEMWDHLLSTEESRTLNDVRRMVNEWETLKQLPSETMQQFIRRIDLLASKLLEVNRVKDQDDKLYKLLDGMGPHWDTQKAAFEVTANIQTYKEVCAILLGISVQRGEAAGDIAAGGEAHSTVGGYKGKFPKGGWKSREGGKGNFNSVLFCRACGSRDHHTANCPKHTLQRDYNGYKCHKRGHVVRDCTEGSSSESK